MVTYQNDLKGISLAMLSGFFVGWPEPPSDQKLLKILQNSAYICLAIKDNQVIGFITAISDKTISAYIPLLEVLLDYQRKQIGKLLVSNMLKQVAHLYMADLCCDDDLV